MEDDLKYFIPEISDLHIGYEYEQALIDCNWSITSWEKRIVTESSDLKLIKEYPSLHRTLYLTKEQIEAEGWIYKGKAIDIWFYKEGDFTRTSWTAYKVIMHYNLEDKWMHIYLEDQGNDHDIFRGKCPSINEFRIIQKLLNI